MTPECQNCGAHTSERYARVFTPDHLDGPRCCPECPDRMRGRNGVRTARSARRNPAGVDESADDIAGDGEEVQA